MVQIREGSQVHQAISSSLPNSTNTKASVKHAIEVKGVVGQSQVSVNEVSLPRRDVDFAVLQVRNDRLHQTARTVRTANKIMDKIGSLINDKQFEINQYEKQYPPFQNQSSDHIKFLNSISSLKRQVDALTLVPDNKELASIVSEPYTQTEGPSVSDEPTFPLSRQEIHSGENGLNIASLDTNTSDVEVHQFGLDLDKSRIKLSQRQAGLQYDAKLIAEHIIHADENMSVGKKILENEQDAVKKSTEIQTALMQLSPGSLGGEQTQKILESFE